MGIFDNVNIQSRAIGCLRNGKHARTEWSSQPHNLTLIMATNEKQFLEKSGFQSLPI